MRYLVLIFILLAAGCASTPKNEDSSALNSTQYFLDSETQHWARLSVFLGAHQTEWTEFDKIDYLLDGIKESQLTFVRNGDYFDGKKASRWLRWKMRHPQYKTNPIDTADEFVNVVSVGSVNTGVPYQIKLPNGRFVKVRSILQTELDSLEEALVSRAALSEQGLIPAPKEEATHLEAAPLDTAIVVPVLAEAVTPQPETAAQNAPAPSATAEIPAAV